MIASITLLADAFHEAARMVAAGQRRRLRVIAARLLETAEDPAPLFPQGVALDCAVVSLGIGEHADALRLLVCRQPGCDEALTIGGSPSATALAGLMADTIAIRIIAWTGATVGFATLPPLHGAWPQVLTLAADGIHSPASGIGVVVAEAGEGTARCQILAALLGDQQAGLTQWVPTTTIRGV